MMDAAQQAKIAAVLHGLTADRIVVSKPVTVAGNVARRVEVSPEEKVAAWVQKGWHVDLVEGTVQADPRQLVLLP